MLGDSIEEVEDDFVSGWELQARIEAWTVKLLRRVTDGKRLPTLSMVSREQQNVVFLDDGQVRLGEKLVRRRYTASNEQTYLRTWLVLAAAHRLLVRRERITQRGLFYSLVACFRTQEQLNEVLKDCVQLLRCSRDALGIVAEARGRLGGAAEARYAAGPWISLRRLSGMRIVAGVEARAAVGPFQMPARYVLVVEKDAVFQTLIQERLCDQLPLILVSGGGFPDYATRALLARLHDGLGLPVFGLFDFNPSGVHVFLSYRVGSAAAGMSNRRLTCPVNLLGVGAADVDDPAQFRPLTPRERVLADNLLARSPFVAQQPKLAAHIQDMQRLGSAEIEAVQRRRADAGARLHPLVDLIVKKILRRKCITV